MRHVAMVVLSQYPGDPRVRREAEALARHGVTVDVVCYRNPDQAPVEQLGLVTAHRIMTVRDKTSIARYLAFSQGFGLAAFAKLQELARRRRYDVVQVHNMPDQLVFTTLGLRLQGIPVVLDLHDLMVELFESKWRGARARVMLPAVRLVERASCAYATRLITTSVGFRERLIARGIPAAKVELVLNAADTNIFFRPADGVLARDVRRDHRLARPRLVYHGTVARRFGVHVLIEAVARLRAEGREPLLRIHGKYDADYRRDLEQLVAKLGLDGAVTLGGYLSHEEIRELLYDMDVGVVPYLSDLFMELALSTKSFEYVAMGLPVVASRVAAMTSLFSDDAIRYFAPGNAADLAAQIAFFCDDPAARRVYPERAEREYERIAWPVMEARYVALMEDVARRAASSR